MYRLRPLAGFLAQSTKPWLSGSAASAIVPAVTATCQAFTPSSSITSLASRGLHTSWAASGDVEARPEYDASQFVLEPERKFKTLADKEMWHEAWMYEDRFGSETEPIVVPSLEDERIIGVTDPEDENLIVWGILMAGEPPRQFIENGEYYLLKVVPQVKKVGDVLMQLQGSADAHGAAAPLPA